MPRSTRFHTGPRRSSSCPAGDRFSKLQFCVAMAVIIMFAAVCLGSLFAPDTRTFDRLLPFVAPQLTLVLHYYFGQRERN